MAKLLLFLLLLVCLSFVVTCMGASLYTVGDTAGWDISSALDSWPIGKTFNVGDSLVFQYSSYHSVSELTKGNYNACNVSNPIMSSSDGNTTIPLTKPGERYFACGNRLHCLGGMKMQVTVLGDQASSTSPAIAPAGQGDPSSEPNSSNKKNTPTIPTSAGVLNSGRDSIVFVCVVFVVSVLSFVI